MAHRSWFLSLARLGALACSFAPGSAAAAQIGTVLGQQKISATEGGFGGDLDPSDQFGGAIAALGDLDGDGVTELAVGARSDDDGGSNQGAVWLLFLNADGTVRVEQKISETAGGFGGALDSGDVFGGALAALGDLDGDGVVDLAVGAEGDDDGTVDRGAFWILFLNADGTVKSEQKISETAGGFGGPLHTRDFFGGAIACLGDLDGDGVVDLAVGAVYDDDGNLNQGAVWIVFLNADGTVKAEEKISETAGGFGGALDPDDRFGRALACPGDLDGDGVADLAVGANLDDDGSAGGQGAIWILFLNADGSVKAEQKISEITGGFAGDLSPADNFAYSLASWGDLDGDGVGDLAVGAPLDDDGEPEQGAIWILFLRADGTVKFHQKVSETEGGFGGALEPDDQFALSVACAGDIDGDGIADLVGGSNLDDDGGNAQGAVWVLFLEGDTTAPTLDCPRSASVLMPKGAPPAGALVFFSVTASDLCDPSPSVLCTPPSGSFFPYGTTMVTCVATDAAGNQTVRQFPVFVRPSVRPR